MTRAMRLLLVLTMLLVGWGALATTASADAPNGFNRAPAGAAQATVPDFLAPITITQNTDVETVAGGVACGNQGGGYTTQNSYYRRFDLDTDYGITDTLTLQNFTFGVGNTDNSFLVTIRAYSIPSTATLNLANLTDISTATVTTTDADIGTLVTVPVTGSISGTLDLVMEIDVASGESVPAIFYIGANEGGQTGPSYIAAADCGIGEPTDLASIGFPDSAVIMIVGGDTGTPTAVSLGDLTATANDRLPIVTFAAAGLALLGAGLVVLRRK